MESGEPLIAVCGARIVARALYTELGISGALQTVLVRQGVLARLQRAAENLPESLTLVVFDGFRPLAVQQSLFNNFAAQIRSDFPESTEEERLAKIHAFVASPNPSLLTPPPHRTGGAVDVYLLGSDGEPSDMGTEPDELSPRSITRWYETQMASSLQMTPRENRRILFHAMISAGFTNYSGEWWHYDFGNQRWANVAGEPCAIYGVPQEDREQLVCTL